MLNCHKLTLLCNSFNICLKCSHFKTYNKLHSTFLYIYNIIYIAHFYIYIYIHIGPVYNYFFETKKKMSHKKQTFFFSLEKASESVLFHSFVIFRFINECRIWTFVKLNICHLMLMCGLYVFVWA